MQVVFSAAAGGGLLHMQLPPIVMALLGTGAAFLMTALGAASVLFIKKETNQEVLRLFLGFAAGVMISASVFSLILPALELAQAGGGKGILPVAGGFIGGVLFLLLLDMLIPHLHAGTQSPEGPRTRLADSTLLVLAVTLHNIPEGMALGLSFALASEGLGSLAGALVLCAGIGLQNLPEGAAVSLPLKSEGLSKGKAFVLGALSGVVEPIGGVVAVLLAGRLVPVMPWLLSFAAGAMLYVVIEELIPEAHLGEHSNRATLSALAGFVLMMVLDLALG